MSAAGLTIGPVLFNWPPEKWRDFHFRIADEAPVDSVCVGEVVCSKRAPMFEPHLAEVVERLEAAGKEVVLSTLTLIMSDPEMAAVRDTAGAEEWLVEANDVAACALLAGRPHAVGPLVNVYNEDTLGYLARNGAVRVCLPCELPASSLEKLAAGGGPELEVQAFGRLPLAISARCYHARSHGLHKDNCQFVCGEDADGMAIETIDGKPFLAVNGTQTLSYAYLNLLGELAALRTIGIDRFRLSPHDVDMVAVAVLFREVLDGRLEPQDATARLAALVEGAPFCNGYYHDIAGDAFTAAAAE